MAETEMEKRIGETAALFVRGAADGNTSPRVTHPDAVAAWRTLNAAAEEGNVQHMLEAATRLYRVCGALEMTMETMARLWIEKRPADAGASLERIATAAIKLAEQVVAANLSPAPRVEAP